MLNIEHCKNIQQCYYYTDTKNDSCTKMTRLYIIKLMVFLLYAFSLSNF